MISIKKAIALTWGLATVLPFLFIIYITYAMFGMDPSDHETFQLQFDFNFRLGTWINAGTVGLLISYIIYLFKTGHVPKDKKVLWAVVLFMGNAVSMPIFWFIYVWLPIKDQSERNT